MATSFDFPKYSVEQLVEAFRSELGAEFDIRPDDFANPVVSICADGYAVCPLFSYVW